MEGLLVSVKYGLNGFSFMKVKKGPRTALFPCPVVLVTSVGSEGKPNIITLAWAGIEESGEFVVNIPTTEILEQTDFCGAVSGKDVDKFSATGLTPEPAEKVKPPLIRECPVNIECTVKRKIPLGVHHLFLGEVVCVHIDEEILDEEGGIDFTKVSPFVYNQGEYWSLNKKIAVHGFTEKQ